MEVVSVCPAETLHTVRDMEEFNKLLQESANRMQSSISIRLDKKLNGQELNKVLTSSLCLNHVRGYNCSKRGKNDYMLHMKYMDSTRMLAAFRNPELASRLSVEETRALEVARKRIRTCVKKGIPEGGQVAP